MTPSIIALRTSPVDGTIHHVTADALDNLLPHVTKATEVEGNLVWIPPEWFYHMVRTVQPQEGCE